MESLDPTSPRDGHNEGDGGLDAVVALGLTKKYSGVAVLRQVTLRVIVGETLVMMGGNGAGKTTLLHLIALLREPTAGSLALFGIDAVRQPRRLRTAIGYVGHQTCLYLDMTAIENLTLYADLFGVERPDSRIGELLRHVDLWRCREQRVRTFSRGMRQRLELARALVHDPRLLLLDEPDTGLDAEAIGVLTRVLRAPRSDGGMRTNVVATHRDDWGKSVADHVIVIDRGRVVDETNNRGDVAS